MKMLSVQLFVYGSLRSGFRNPAYAYLSKHFSLIGEGLVKGRFYDNGDFPVAVPVSEDHFIHGELYQLNNPEEFGWAFGQLDDYEGVHTEEDEAPWYRRDLVDVFREGNASKAWIYWYNKPVSGLPPVETGDVMKYLQMKNKP